MTKQRLAKSHYNKTTSGGAFVSAVQFEDGTWEVDVTDTIRRPIGGIEREQALKEVNDELSSLRAHIWRHELGHI